MAIRVPIQERDTVNTQRVSPVFENNPITTPIQGDLGKPLSQYSSILAKKEEDENTRIRQFLKAKTQNEIDAQVDQATEEVVNAQGENSFKVADLTQEKLKQSLDKTLMNVPEQYRPEYGLLVDQGVQRFNKTSQGHQYSEQRKIVDQTYKLRANNLTDKAALSAYDLEGFEKNLLLLDQTTEVYTRNKMGGDPNLNVEPSTAVREAIDIQKKEARSTLIYKTIQSLTSAEDADTANFYAQRYQGLLTAADTNKVNELLKKGRVNQRSNIAKALYDETINLYPDDEEKGLRYIGNATKDGDVYKEALGMYKSGIAVSERQRRKDREASKASAMDALRKNGGALTSDILKTIDPEDKSDMVQYAQRVSRGETIPRNSKVYNELQRMYLEEPERFGDLDLQAYRHQIPYSDIIHLESKQKETRDPLSAKMKSSVVSDITRRIIKTQVGTKYKPSSDKYKEKEADIQSLADETLEAVKNSLPERTSPEEVRKKFESEMMLKTKVNDTRGWLDKTLNVVNDDWGQSPPPEPRNQTRIFADYDPADVETVKQEFTVRRKRPPTDAELAKSLRSLRQRKYIK